jgi:hypothetical protein
MNFKSKLIITSFMLCVLNITTFGQFNKLNSFEELDSLAQIYFQKGQLDSLILLDEYGRVRFPEQDEKLTYVLCYLYRRTNQDSLTLKNWDYGLKKGYYFGSSLKENSKRFKGNPEYNRLAKIDKQIGDSLSNLAHVEYEIVLPTNYSTDNKYPLLFVFHGNNRNLEQAKSVWTSELIQDNFIAVYLQSYIFMSKFINKGAYQWKLNDEKTNKEFKEIYTQIVDKHSVSKNEVLFIGMSAGGRLAIDYAFSDFLPVNGLVLNCPVIPNVSDSSIHEFVDENKKIAIITGENDWALNKQKDLINKVDSIGGNSKLIINSGLGHQFAADFPALLDGYLKWMLE